MDFHNWIQARNAVPQIKVLQNRAEKLRSIELKRARRALLKGENIEDVLDILSKSLVNKLIHDSLVTLKNNQKLSDEDYSKMNNLLKDFYRYHGR